MADWFMVGITTIYVVATIVMCAFTYKTWKESRHQFDELKKQYSEQLNLNCMPTLQIDHLTKTHSYNGTDEYWLFNEHTNVFARYIKKTVFLRIKNVGKGIAQDVFYDWDRQMGKRNGNIVSLPVGDERITRIRFVAKKKCQNECRPSLTIKYRDINNVTYQQKLTIYLEISNREIQFLNTSITAPEIVSDREY